MDRAGTRRSNRWARSRRTSIPILQSTTTQAHLTQPQANTVLSQTNALIQSVRTTNTTLQMGLISGGVVQYRNYEQSFKENAPSDLLESGGGSAHGSDGPAQPVAGLRRQVERPRHPDCEDQYRRVAWNRSARSCWTWWPTYSTAIGTWWRSGDESKARQRSQENAQKFFEDTQKEIAAGAIPRVELSRAAAEVATRRQDLVVAQANLRQRENALERDAGAHAGSGGGSGRDHPAGPHRDSRQRTICLRCGNW